MIEQHALGHYLAVNVRRMRQRARWTQQRLADRAGLDVSTVRAVEADARDVSLATVQALARALVCDPRRLLRKPASRRPRRAA